MDKAVKKTSIGGQALIEGTMMQAPKKIAMAIRTPDNRIVVEDISLESKFKSFKLFKLPLVRSIFSWINYI